MTTANPTPRRNDSAGAGPGFNNPNDPRRDRNHPEHLKYRNEVKAWVRAQGRLDRESFPRTPETEEFGPPIVSIRYGKSNATGNQVVEALVDRAI